MYCASAKPTLVSSAFACLMPAASLVQPYSFSKAALSAGCAASSPTALSASARVAFGLPETTWQAASTAEMDSFIEFR